MAIVRTAFKTP